MKVLHVINSLATGGAEKLLIETICEYNKRGIKADVLLLNGTRHPLFKELERKKCCTIFSLGNGSIYNPMIIFKMLKYFKGYQYIHAHLFPTFYYIAVSKFFLNQKKKIIFTEHSTSNRRMQSFLKILDKFIYLQYDKVICISNQVKKIVEEHTKIKGDKIVLIENGINIQKFAQADGIKRSELNHHLKDEDFVIVQVSSFQPPKDHVTLLDSLLFLPKSVKLILVGDGILRKKTEALAKSLHIEDRVVFLGYREDVNKIYKMSDVAVLSSSWEGFGLVAVEAMASGIPFIASNVSGIREIVDGAGVLFQPGDSKELAEKIKQLLENKEDYNKIVLQSKKRAEMYSIENTINKHIHLYQNLEKI